MTVRRTGNATFGELKAKLRALPVSVAHRVASQAAPAVTDLTVAAFTSGRSVYGDRRPLGADGGALTLERTGRTRQTLKFVANGTIVRCVLGTKHARYLIGKYGILPNGAMPVEWTRRLRELTTTEIKRAL
jgi:hypothetical protein